MQPRQTNDHRDTAVLIALFGLFLLVSPLTLWWTGATSFWFLPYLLWLLIIALAGLNHSRYGL
jgi:hypothetical protein